ncbi:MAG: hypothetical protein ABMA13_14675 [Chthoniobacteraceae bacterium]
MAAKETRATSKQSAQDRLAAKNQQYAGITSVVLGGATGKNKIALGHLFALAIGIAIIAVARAPWFGYVLFTTADLFSLWWTTHGNASYSRKRKSAHQLGSESDGERTARGPRAAQQRHIAD